MPKAGWAKCATWADNQIAKHCGVNHSTVAAVRAHLANFARYNQPVDLPEYTPSPGRPQIEAGPFNPCAGCGCADPLRVEWADYPHPGEMPGDVDLICTDCGRSLPCHTNRTQAEQWNEYNPLPPGAPAPIPIPAPVASTPTTRTVTRNGVTYEMQVGNIGKRSASGPGPRGFETMGPWRGANADGLLPCPFCGSADVALKRDDEDSDCCGICRDRDCNAIGPRFRDPDRARDAWNRRAR